MKCYLINLDRSTDRLAYMAAQLSRVGLEYLRVPAVDGRSLTPSELRALVTINDRWKAPLTPSEVGCFLSHRRCLEEIAKSSDQYAMVVEDDIEFAQDTADFIREIDCLPSNADLVKFETNGKKVLIDAPTQIADTRYAVARLLSTHIMSAGYIVSKDAAARLLAQMDKAWAPIDQFIFSAEHGVFDELVIYQCTPALCRQAGLASTLNKDRRNANRRPAVRKRVLREIKRPFKRSLVGIWGIWTNVTTKRRWGRIPFV